MKTKTIVTNRRRDIDDNIPRYRTIQVTTDNGFDFVTKMFGTKQEVEDFYKTQDCPIEHDHGCLNDLSALYIHRGSVIVFLE